MEVQTKKSLIVELLQVEMSSKFEGSCSACDTVQSKLVSAIKDVQNLFDQLNCEILFKQIGINTVEEAKEHGITASPTIRVNNLDFFPRHISDCSEEREWSWNGLTMSSPDKEVFIEVLLKGYFEAERMPKANELSPYILKHLKTNRVQKADCECR